MADNLKETEVNQESKSKLSLLWNKLDLFSKIVVVIIGVVALLFIIALCMGNILSIIFSVFQVAGLIVALLLHKDRIKTNQKWVKYIALIISIVLLALNVFTCFNDLERKEISHKVETPYSAEYCLGKNYKTVESDFSSMGFTNISFEPMEDLELSETDKFGVVELISINGIDSFDGNESFKSTAKIIIKYHSYKSAKVPFSTEEAKTLETNSIIESLEKVGFVNITTDEVYDLDPDVVKTDFENEVTIEEVASFEKNEKFSLDSEIKIVTHRPYEKYTLKISVDFVPNLMFSKYDVNLEINGQKEILQHGKDGEFEYRFKKGDYTLKFSSVTDNSIKGSVDIKLTGDTNASYKIYCYNDEISVETIYVENKSAVGENEVMIPLSASNCMFENYKDIEKIFKDAGFTNITTEILYDIVWGWTEEGEVDSISIDGNSGFIRGDIFAKDAKIVITYHMGVEDDPNASNEQEVLDENNQSEDSAAKENSKPTIITITNDEEFASLMETTDATDSETIKSFTDSHIDSIIEFDGCIALMMKHKNYNTRFDVCMAGGNYNSKVSGPLFAFEDVNYYDMNVTGSDSVAEGMEFKITAKIKGFNEEGCYIILEPISLKAR